MAGLLGQEFCSAYAAAKFGVEGFTESLATEVEQVGISTTIVEPGFFRTDLLTPESTTWAELSIDDYAEQAAATKKAWQGMNGQQGGDPAKLARALVEIIGSDEPPARWVAALMLSRPPRARPGRSSRRLTLIENSPTRSRTRTPDS